MSTETITILDDLVQELQERRDAYLRGDCRRAGLQEAIDTIAVIADRRRRSAGLVEQLRGLD